MQWGGPGPEPESENESDGEMRRIGDQWATPLLLRRLKRGRDGAHINKLWGVHEG